MIHVIIMIIKMIIKFNCPLLRSTQTNGVKGIVAGERNESAVLCNHESQLAAVFGSSIILNGCQYSVSETHIRGL